MKELRLRIILIVGAIALSLYLLYPTFQDYQNNKEVSKILEVIKDSIKVSDPTISNIELQDIISVKKDSILSTNESFKKARQ